MKKISKLNIIAIVTIGIILLIIPISIQANGRDASKRINKYVALGDEVASESKDYYDVSYVSLIKDFFLHNLRYQVSIKREYVKYRIH